MVEQGDNVNHYVENFIVCWLEPTACETVNTDNLRHIINLVKIFTSPDECIDYITDIRDENIFLLIRDSLAKQILSDICDIDQIKSIYILSEKETMHTEWTKGSKKIGGVFGCIDEIYLQLKSDVQKLANNLIDMSFLPTGEGNDVREKNQQEVVFMYSQLLKEIFIRMKNEQDVKKKIFHAISIQFSFNPTFYAEFEDLMRSLGYLPVDETQTFVEFCKQHYYDNQYQLNLISEFEKNYNPSQSIWWYTRPTFLYEMLNKALRTQDINVLYSMRFFLVDLHNKLMELHNKSSRCSPLIVYRGQGVSNEELEKLKKSCGRLLSIGNFLSTSIDKEVALGFAFPHLDRPGYKAILFEISVYPTETTNSPYADISKESYLQGTMSENEVLFSMGSVFRIQLVNQLNNGMWKVTMTMTNDEDRELKEVTKNKLEELNIETNSRSIGLLLLETQNFDKAEYFLQLRLKEAFMRVNDKLCRERLEKVVNSLKLLGFIPELDFDYKEWCNKQYRYIAMLYSDLGHVFHKKYDHDNALFYYNKLLKLLKNQSLTENRLEAMTYQNIGGVYLDQKRLDDAMMNFERAQKILENDSDVEPLRLAYFYYDIGSLLIHTIQLDQSLLYLEKSLQIRLNYLPWIHPNVGLSHDMVGKAIMLLAFIKRTDGDQQMFKKALYHLETASYIFQKCLLPSNEEVLSNRKHLDFLKTLIK